MPLWSTFLIIQKRKEILKELWRIRHRFRIGERSVALADKQLNELYVDSIPSRGEKLIFAHKNALEKTELYDERKSEKDLRRKKATGKIF